MLKASTLRPGFLVSLKTSLTGNVSYERVTIEALHKVETGEEVERWETGRTVTNPEEFERAKAVRSKARQLVRRVCAESAFGLLCPEDKAEKLEAAMVEARGLVDAFNEGAGLSRIGLYVMAGRVAPDDAEAVRAINSEVRDLMETMEDGLKRLDAKAIRDAADRAKKLGMMLTDNARERVEVAIEVARSAARKIVKAGEQAASVVDRASIRKITEMRTAFLDLDEAKEVAAPTVESRALDLEPEPVALPAMKAEASSQIALELV